jgi:hypothetical protein
MWTARMPTENWAGRQAHEGAGPGRTWSFRDGVRAGSGRAGWVMALSSGRARLPGALLAHSQNNRYGTGADKLGSCGCRLLEAASQRP